jgi:hypothetical protein
VADDVHERGECIELGTRRSAIPAFAARNVRKKAFHAYYTQYEAHKNTIAAALDGSVKRDVYYAKARNYGSADRIGVVPRPRADERVREPHRVGARETCRRSTATTTSAAAR